ncbi:MAG: pyruvate dehydrogenase complex dihydrolipoamide acetyltransferase [Bacteroidetes bacterium]|nr:pyruvate dehydrogenase complex dihydrolipoamide acetyltransferase [Bacteroidota bacterium]
MAEEILMPRLSDTMTEGVIATWHKKVGDSVKKGDLLAEIETDKATMDLESYKEGTLLYTGGEKGSKIQVNALLAIIGKEGEDISKLLQKYQGAVTEMADTSKDKNAESSTTVVEENVSGNQKTSLLDEATENNLKTEAISLADEIVLMPRLSDTMTEGVVAAWHKNVGDDVKKGDLLADIETDKATMELESYKNGKLLYQGAAAGEKIAVNSLLCIIGQEGFNVEAAIKSVASQAGPLSNDETNKPVETETVQDKPSNKSHSSNTSAAPINSDGRIFISPLAKRLAEEKGIDITQIHGSGEGGRIVKSDIDHFSIPQKNEIEQVVAQGAVYSEPLKSESFDTIPVSQMRGIIAKRLGESKFSAPHFYLTMAINMDAVADARTKLNEQNKTKVSYNDIILKACSIALRKNPKVNSSWLGDKIRYNHHIHIGVAVAVEDGLLVPVVRFADTKSVSYISTEVKDFAQKAKDKKLQPKDWEGSTFTISNLGMFGIEEFTAIINPPDACILAVGGIIDTPLVKNGEIVPGKLMKVTLSCDHRVVDGATGAAFLQTLKLLLEEPLGLVW